MKPSLLWLLPLFLLTISACAGATEPSSPPTLSASATLSTPLPPSPTETLAPTHTLTPAPTLTASATITPTTTATFLPTVESLSATVNVDLLSCRYGPGPEYLYLYALRRGARIQLIGRTEGNNWVWVSGQNKCWVNAKFLDINGDQEQLPIVYPGIARLPVSPYYPPTTVLGATRTGNRVTVHWADVPLRAGDEEDESMLHYIIEVWRCEAGQIIFEPLATNELSITFVDEPGCAAPSHGRVFVQEKHGYAGPAEIPWPAP